MKRQKGVVYEVPVTCGHMYNGQTGRFFFYDRALEHKMNIKKNIWLGILRNVQVGVSHSLECMLRIR